MLCGEFEELLMAEVIELDVVIYQSQTHWIAQGLQYDITAQAENPVELPKKFMTTLVAEAMVAQELGETPFENIPPAPRRFWELYKAAKATLVADEAPSPRVSGKGLRFHAPALKMKITGTNKAVA